MAKFRPKNGHCRRTFGAIFFKHIALNTLLYRHFLPHKDGTNPPVHKPTAAVDEDLAGEVVMEFDMPDPGQAGWVRGALTRKE